MQLTIERELASSSLGFLFAYLSRRWRKTSGHALDNLDAATGESLTQRVCRLDKSLDTSGLQVDMLEML